MATINNLDTKDTLTAHIFKIFEEIRTKLIQEGGIDNLPLDFPIVEMEPCAEMSNYLGMCHFAVCVDKDEPKRLRQIVDRISMRVLCKPSNSAAEGEEIHFHLLRLIPTLLHELAHVTTELHRSHAGSDTSNWSNRKLKRLDHSDHDELFYEQFRRILKAAELLGIYSLP